MTILSYCYFTSYSNVVTSRSLSYGNRKVSKTSREFPPLIYPSATFDDDICTLPLTTLPSSWSRKSVSAYLRRVNSRSCFLSLFVDLIIDGVK